MDEHVLLLSACTVGKRLSTLHRISEIPKGSLSRWSSSPDVVACLLDGGAEVNDCGGDDCVGVTPLIDSASNGHFDIVKLLVQRGANVLQKDAKEHIIFIATYIPCQVEYIYTVYVYYTLSPVLLRKKNLSIMYVYTYTVGAGKQNCHVLVTN